MICALASVVVPALPFAIVGGYLLWGAVSRLGPAVVGLIEEVTFAGVAIVVALLLATLAGLGLVVAALDRSGALGALPKTWAKVARDAIGPAERTIARGMAYLGRGPNYIVIGVGLAVGLGLTFSSVGAPVGIPIVLATLGYAGIAMAPQASKFLAGVL